MTTPPRIAGGGWFKSSRSAAAGECVEVNFDHHDGLVRIRDTKDRGAGPTISVTGEQWAVLLDQLASTVAAGSIRSCSCHRSPGLALGQSSLRPRAGS